MQAAAASDPGCAPNVITYSALMTACCAGGRPDAAQQVFRSMRAAGVQPDHITYSTLLAGAAPRRPGRRWRHRALLERARLPRQAPGVPRAVDHLTACICARCMPHVRSLCEAMRTARHSQKGPLRLACAGLEVRGRSQGRAHRQYSVFPSSAECLAWRAKRRV